MKKIRLLLLFLIVIISISNSLYGQIKNIESSSFTISRENFKNDFGSNWDVIINEKTGLPRMIKNGNTKRYVGNPKEAALTFLNEYRDLFGMKKDLTDLVHQKTITNKYGLSSITFQQFYENILVEEAQIKVHQFKDGRIGMANGFYYPNITISTIPKYPLSQAIEKVKNDIPLTSEENFKTNLIILPTIDGGYNLTWKINIFNENPFIDVLYFVDAFSGVIIEKRDLSMHVTGTGNVYPTHPNMSSITTKDLYRLNGTGYLEGTYVKVLNDTTVEAYSVSNNFQYSYSSTHFDEVNLYYHVDDFRHNFIEPLGSPQFTQITAHAHSVSSPGPNSAWFSPTTGDIYFGTAPSGILNDFAKEDKVIYHEYSHAVFYDI